MSTTLGRLHRRHHHALHRDQPSLPIIPRSAANYQQPDRTIHRPDLVRREVASSTCAPNDNGPACQKPVSGQSFTTPIVVGTVYVWALAFRALTNMQFFSVPLALAVIIFIILHRRHVRKLRSEDANDRHKSLDFGMDPVESNRRKKQKRAVAPEMRRTNKTLEQSLRRGRGLSMDIGSPYILPPGLQGSQESIHSLSRTLHDNHDPYREATNYSRGESPAPTYHSSRLGGDDSSRFSQSTVHGYRQEGMKDKLLDNAGMLAKSQASNQRESDGSFYEDTSGQEYRPTRVDARKPLLRQDLDKKPEPEARDSYAAKDGADLRRSNNYLGAFIESRDPLLNQGNSESSTKAEGLTANSSASQSFGNSQSPPARKQSLPTYGQQTISNHAELESHYPGPGNRYEFDDNAASYPPESFVLPELDASAPLYSTEEKQLHEASGQASDADAIYGNRRVSVLRPLPPDDPSDNPEQRANRIRSFYKEYFNESEPTRAHAPPLPTYHEDYREDYLAEGTALDLDSGHLAMRQAPYAEPVTRRAMTPPPRAPPRFQSPAHHQYHSSNPNYMVPRSRAASSASASAHRGGPPGRGPQRRPMPPPAPLRTLPTPYLLKEDAFALPIDFAPPTNTQDRRAGRPDSPLMQMRPYSPQVSVASPLVSSFSELPVMPSP